MTGKSPTKLNDSGASLGPQLLSCSHLSQLLPFSPWDAAVWKGAVFYVRSTGETMVECVVLGPACTSWMGLMGGRLALSYRDGSVRRPRLKGWAAMAAWLWGRNGDGYLGGARLDGGDAGGVDEGLGSAC